MGTAIYKLRRSHIISMTESGDVKHLSLNDIAYVLTKMPANTSISDISIEPLAGLFLEYNISLVNPIFKDGTEIIDNSEYTRDIGFTKSNKLVEYNRPNDFNLEDVVRKHDEVDSER